MNKIILGTESLIACCAFYLIWWVLAFKPDGRKMTTWFWLVFAAIFGLAGVVITVMGINSEKPGRSLFGIGPMIAGIVIYAVLLYVTSHFMHRQVTTELILIVGWAVLEISALDTMQCFNSVGGITTKTALILMAVVILMAVASMVAYLLYYGLDAVKGYIDGMIPLILIAGTMIAELVVVRIQR